MKQDPLNLRRLPPLDPPAELWPAIRDQLSRDSRPAKRFSLPRWMPALAAALALGVLLNVLMRAPEHPVIVDPGSAPPKPILAAMDRSASLEAELRARQQGSVSGEALQALLLLETELSWLDLRLAQQPDDVALWRERGELLSAMILRYAEPLELALWQASHL